MPKARSAEEEGCLSIPGFRGYVIRPQFVTVRRRTPRRTFEIRGENLLARAFCHELDHLNGRAISAASEHPEARPDSAARSRNYGNKASG